VPGNHAPAVADRVSASSGAEQLAVDVPNVPGRTCPLSYRYGPRAFRTAPSIPADTLLVVGGLYGNVFAADTIEAMLDAEGGIARLVLNGDYHWFDADPADFARIDAFAGRHVALRGNVETELADDADVAGCGCGYPDWVADADVDRSNEIIRRLRGSAHDTLGPHAAALAALPMFATAEVGGLRVGVLHGDCWSLAGWRFAQETLDREAHAIGAAFDEAGVDVFASSHTCLPVARAFTTGTGGGWLINNGAAGMPNFAGTRFGLATRISVRPSSAAIYRAVAHGVCIEAVPIRFDADAWRRRFESTWPAGSPASISYARRISEGPDFRPEQAVRAGFAMT